MRILIAAIGRLKSGPERELADLYVERAATAGRRAGISAVTMTDWPESPAATPELRKAEEGSRLLGASPAGATVLALDERGKDFSSDAFAAELRRLRDSGAADLAFLIGGPDGLHETALARAKTSIAFGRMTWPHRLARVMLAEQIYRSVTILLNHPYHRA